MTITAKVIEDSISPEGIRLTTLQLRYPRFIHAEFMTHRVFSRNASSSRAIPIHRLIEDVETEPATPIHWGKNQKGMQAHEEIDNRLKLEARAVWWTAMMDAVKRAKTLADLGVHKQIVNRIIEPWSHINVVVTSTKWANFFALRDHPDAQPEIRALARTMKDAMKASKPRLLNHGEWHLPYVDSFRVGDRLLYVGENRDVLPEGLAKKISVARCARVSYLTHDGRKPTIEEDLRLYDKLIRGNPIHASPFEHQATPDRLRREHEGLTVVEGEGYSIWDRPHLHGNFHGWIQHRKMIEGECVQDPLPKDL